MSKYTIHIVESDDQRGDVDKRKYVQVKIEGVCTHQFIGAKSNQPFGKIRFGGALDPKSQVVHKGEAWERDKNVENIDTPEPGTSVRIYFTWAYDREQGYESGTVVGSYQYTAI